MTVSARCSRKCEVKERRRRRQSSKDRARFGEKEKRREMADLLGLPRLVESLQNNASFSGKTWTYCACRKEKKARAAFDKRRRNRAICPDYQIVRWRVKVSESHFLARKRRIGAGASVERVDFTVKERQVLKRRGRASQENFLPKKWEKAWSGWVSAKTF